MACLEQTETLGHFQLFQAAAKILQRHGPIRATAYVEERCWTGFDLWFARA
jgi:hypothetical protein